MQMTFARLARPFLFLAWILAFAALPASAAVRINTLTCDRTTVSKGQTGIQVFMEVENLAAAPVTLSVATLTFSLGTYEVNLNSPALGSSIPANGKVICAFTLSVNPLSPSGVCVIDGEVQTSGGNDAGSDLTHSWTVQQPSELVITSILGPAVVNRGSNNNQAIMDVARTGEADVNLNHVDLAPLTPLNYPAWNRTSPTLPQNFSKSSWWNSRFPFRRQMTISNRSTSTLPASYEIAFTFDHAALIAAGKSWPTGNDIRIVYDNGTSFQEISRFLDPMQSAWASTTTTIWFRLQEPLGPAPQATQKYTLYYGASIADSFGPPANAANVFTFYDSCENGPNGWTTNFLAGYPTARWELGPVGAKPPGDPDGWTHPPNTVIYWPAAAYSPGNCWATDLDGYYRGRNPAAEVLWLYSPTINLAGKLNPTLTFFNFLDIEDPSTPFDWGTLNVRQEATPRPGSLLRTLLSRHIDETETGWRKETFSLNSENGRNVYLEFILRVDQVVLGFGWAIDDIRIRQIAIPEPNNPLLGFEEKVPTVPTIKAYFEVDVSQIALSGLDTIDGVASGTEGNTGLEISDHSATLPLVWTIRAQDFLTFGNPFYVSSKDTFNVGEIVYGRGSGYPTGTTYIVRWYNPGNVEVLNAQVVPNNLGQIFHSRTLQSADLAGQWRIRVENLSGSKILAEVFFNLNIPSQLVSEYSIPESLIVGQSFQMTSKVSNTGQTTAVGVVPSALSQFGGGAVSLVSGPTPLAQTIPGGQSREFSWTYVAQTQGRKSFRGNASGTIEGSSLVVFSASSSSNLATIRQEAFAVTAVFSPDATVNRGQSGLPVTVTLTNAGTADLSLATASLVFRQGMVDVTPSFAATLTSPLLPGLISGNPFPGWWNAAYRFRQRLRLTSDTTAYPASCSARIKIKTDDLIAQGKLTSMANDWRVVMFSDTTGSWTELDRYPESSETTWFAIRNTLQPNSTDESYYVYYGNSAAGVATATNREKVFLFFEDWESPNVNNGRLGTTWNAGSFPEWAFSEPRDGLYLVNGAGRSRNAQVVGFQRLRFPAAPPYTGAFASYQRTINLTSYPQAKIQFFYWWGGGSWDAVDDWNWGRVAYWDGVASTTLLTLASNGPNDSTLTFSGPYDLSALNKTAASRFSFEGNFYYANGSELYFDDITCFMEAPDAIGQGEETQPVTTMGATFSVSIGLGAPAGVVTLDAAATCTSLVATGSFVDASAATTDSWTIGAQTVETYADVARTQQKDQFSKGQTVQAYGENFAPGAYTVRWYDGYPTGGNLVKTDNPAVAGAGTFQVSHAPATFGVWLLQITGPANATGTFRVSEKPTLIPTFQFDPATSTLGDLLTASLTVQASPVYEDFESYAIGNLPNTNWIITTGAGSVTVANTTYSDNPPTQFAVLSGTNTTIRMARRLRMPQVFNQKLNFSYSFIPNGLATFTIEASANGGGAWTSVATFAALTGTGNWQTAQVSLPASLNNNLNGQVRFNLFADALGIDRLCLDKVFLSGSSDLLEAIQVTPETWATSTFGTGNALVQTSPAPVSGVVSCDTSASFQGTYTPISVTTAGSRLYLHGAGTPVRLAGGISLVDGGACDLADSLSSGINVYEEKLTVTPSPLHLGTVLPGMNSTPKNLTIQNTGNIALEYTDWEMHNLSTAAYFIPFSAITMYPDPVGLINVASSRLCSAAIMIPPATPPGTYSALQFAFEDNDQSGNSTGEAIGQFDMQVHVPVSERLQVGTTSLFLGSWLANNTTSTHTALVSNVGNRNLTVVRFLSSDFLRNGTDATRRIASSNVQLSPVAIGYMVAGDSKWQSFSVKVIPSPITATGTFIATGTFFNDQNANAVVDAGEASATMSLFLIIGPTETFTVTPVPVALGNRLPGELCVSGLVYASNTGGLPLENLKFDIATMSETTGDVIPPSFISMSPDPLPAVNVGASTSFRIYINVPFGAAESVGGHEYGEQLPQSNQYLYNDKNKNGKRDAGEAAVAFQATVKVGRTASFTISEEIANFGTGLPGETLKTTVDVISIGNDKCQKMKWLVTGDVLTSGANTISFPPGAGTFVPYAGAGWLLDVPPGQTHQLATLTLAIPLGTPVGVYTGRCRLFNDTIGAPWGTYNVGEPTDEFDLRVEVGAQALDILDPSPFSLGVGEPASSSVPVIFSVKNTGQRTLNDLKYQKPVLTSGGFTIPSPAVVYSTPDPIGLLNEGAVWAPTVYVNVPVNQEAGLYSNTLYVYQDDNHDGAMVAELNDSLLFQLNVQLKRILRFSPTILDMGGINKGQSVTKNFQGMNYGNRPLSALRWTIPDLKDGGNIIPAANLNLQIPEAPWTIPYVGVTTELATLTISTDAAVPTGNFTGELFFWEDSTVNGVYDVGEDFWTLKILLSVGTKDLEIIEPSLDFGVVAKGTDSTTANLTIRNIGTVYLSNTRIVPGDLLSGVDSIPASDLHFGTLQVVPPNLNPGVTRSVNLFITVAAGLTSGFYNGAQRVYEDLDNDGMYDAGEPTDVATVTVLVTSGGALSFELFNNPATINLGTVGRGVSKDGSFQIISLSANVFSNIQYQKTDLTGGASPLPQASVGFAPAAGYSINPFDTQNATVTVVVPLSQPAGSYSGLQRVVDLPHLPEASAPLTISITVPPASLTVSPTTVNLGSWPPGTSASVSFSIGNIGPNVLNLDVLKWPLLLGGVGPTNIPVGKVFFVPQFWNLNGPPTAPFSTVATLGVVIDNTVSPGLYIGTCTFRDLGFPWENQATLSVRLTVISPIGDYVYQTLTNASAPGAIVAGERYVVSAYVMATGTVGGNAILQVREWLGGDIITPAATHTVLLPGPLLSAQPGKWVRLEVSFLATTSASLGSFTVELGFSGGSPGQAVFFDGVQFEKGIGLPSGRKTSHPTPFTPHKGVVSPSEERDLGKGVPYHTW